MTKDPLLGKFMQEFFPFKELVKVGFFTKEMKGDYEAQAKRVCDFFGYETIYEYRSQEVRCHLTYVDRPLHVNPEGELRAEPFVSVIPSIYD